MRRVLSLTLITCLTLTALPAFGRTTHQGTAPVTQEPGSVIVMYEDQSIDSRDLAELSALGARPADMSVHRPEIAVVDVPDGQTAAGFARRLSATPGVRIAAPTGRVQALESIPPDDSRYDDQRRTLGPNADGYIHSIDLEPVWDAVFNGDTHAMEPDRAGVTMAVIDSGVTMSAMEDPGTIVPVWNYVDDDANTEDDFVSLRHGTKVTSALASQTGNSFSVAGALAHTRSPIRVYKTLDRSGYGESVDTMVALMDAADDGVQIANVSLGEPATLRNSFTPDPGQRALWQEVIDYCMAQGMLVVAAAGNGADLTTSATYYPPVWYPAACEGALAVGSINPETGSRSSFSSYGPELDLVAPGERVLVSGPTGLTYEVRGTSFASPIVAGALGVLWSLVPDLPMTEIARIATSTADAAYGEPGLDDETGWGRFDALNAYAEMTTTIPAQSPVTLSATLTDGLEAMLTWPGAAGTGVSYQYGAVGGPTYTTTAHSGRVLLPAGGAQTVWVRPFADDRFDGATTTTTVYPDPRIPALRIRRAQGFNRYATAAMVSAASFTGPVNTVVIASGENWPDGLSASVLAKADDSPLLLTLPDALPTVTRDELLRLAPARICIIGGTNAVSDTVEDVLLSLTYPRTPVIERIGGSDRYRTAAAVADRVKAALGGAAPKRVVIASGRDYPDALSAAPLAAASGWPILLTTPDALPGVTASSITRLGAGSSLVVGGTKAVGMGVLGRLPAPTRVSGDTRYATSRKIAEWGIGQGVLASDSVGVATGSRFPDALAAGPALAQSSTPLLLTDPQDTGLYPWLAARGAAISAMDLFGGTSVISYDTEMALGQALR